MGKIIKCNDGTEFERMSRWITIKTDYNITEKHGLFCYAEEYDDGEYCVNYITHKGYRIAVNAMYLLGSFFISEKPHVFIEKGEEHFINAVDMDGNIYDPFYIELDEWGEKVRLYKKV